MSPWVIALIAAIALLAIAGLVYLAYRRGRGTGTPRRRQAIPKLRRQAMNQLLEHTDPA